LGNVQECQKIDGSTMLNVMLFLLKSTRKKREFGIMA